MLFRSADPEEKKLKAKDVKRKGAAVLTAEPNTKRAEISPNLPRAAGTVCTTTSTPTTPMNAKSSGPCGTCAPADAPSATTGAMAEEEEEV